MVGHNLTGDEDNTVAFEESPIGQDFVKKVDAYYCDICKRYLARMVPLDKVIELHCRTRAHHAAYTDQCSIKKENLDDSNSQVKVIDPAIFLFGLIVLFQVADTQDPIDEESTGMKRSESQERLWRETENDIGGLEEDNHSPFEEGALEVRMKT